MKPLADESGVSLVHAPSHGVLFADRDRVLQTLTNLIGNAIKFSPADTSVTVSATVEGAAVRFCVEDEGRGIPKEKLESIFERFQQVDASDSRQKGGTGLGLAICRSIVRQHGGEIHAESESGAGSRFTFTLPRIQRAAIPQDAPANRLVVVCDDDEVIRDIEVELLENAGYRVLAFESGEALLAAQEVASAEVILLDMKLPGISGVEVAERLRRQDGTRHIPVIIASGSAKVAVPENVRTWLAKPIGADELIDAVRSALLQRPQPQILLVEDDVDVARVVAESLARLGANVLHAITGREAIDLARTRKPDLIVLDLVLPELDGFGVVEYFRRNSLAADVPLVVYTAGEPTSADRERLRLGPTEFLTKSRVTPEEFERHIAARLDAIGTRREELTHVA